MAYIDYGDKEYDSYFEGGDVKLYRHEYEAEQRAVKRIDGFLATLTPADAQLDLFTSWERRWFNLGAHRKRPVE